jgi:hypothetical protein
MIESILFGLAFLATWPAILVLCILGIWCEHNESRGFAVFWALVAGASAFFYFNVSLESIAISSVGYVCFGIVWSFYRYKRFIVAKMEYLRDSNLLVVPLEQRAMEYHPTKMLDTITAWIIIWPFSLVENLCSDIITGIETLVKSVFKGVYHRIFNAALADVIRKDEGVR